MTATDDLETAIRFLKSIQTDDPKTDVEIALVVSRLEALMTGAAAHDDGIGLQDGNSGDGHAKAEAANPANRARR